MLDQFLAAHANAGIADGQRSCREVRLEPDLILMVVSDEFGLVNASKRSRSRASEALEISSLKKISLVCRENGSSDGAGAWFQLEIEKIQEV